MVEGEGDDGGGGVGEVVGVAGAEDLGVWLCRGCGWCLEEAAVLRKEMFYSLYWKRRCWKLFFSIVFAMVSIVLCVSVNPPTGPLTHHRIQYNAATSKN
jgi:hypothetical protein